MRGVAAFEIVRLAGANVGRWRRALADIRAQGGGIRLRQQAGNRHFHGVGIAHESCAVGISAFHRFDHVVQGLLAAELGEVVAFENVEHLDQMYAAG